MAYCLYGVQLCMQARKSLPCLIQLWGGGKSAKSLPPPLLFLPPRFIDETATAGCLQHSSRDSLILSLSLSRYHRRAQVRIGELHLWVESSLGGGGAGVEGGLEGEGENISCR